MKSSEYREIIRIITRKAIRKSLPELKNGYAVREQIADLIAKNIHARLYGANVDGVDSPLWQNECSKKPNVDATKLLEDTK